MKSSQSPFLHVIVFSAVLAAAAAFYSYTIFSNFCMDGDTLNWAASLQPLKDEITAGNIFAVKGWFSKFHLLMFPLIHLINKAYSLLFCWDYLMGFKIFTLVTAVLTIPAIFYICKNTMRHFYIMLFISVIPLFTLGYSWMITTCDDNVLANFFNLLFLISLLIATGAIKESVREKRCLLWAFITGVAICISMASHLKNIVSLPLILALVVVKPPRGQTRTRIAAAGLCGLLLATAILYGLYWVQSTAEPVSSKLDFWVFHRVPGRFYPTPGRPFLSDHVVFLTVGIRSSLYAFQELFINTDLYDGDMLGFPVIAFFFALYIVSAFKTRKRRVVKILFALFALHVGHSLLYDSWVVERWDYFTVPVFITVGIYWDSLLDREGRGAATLKKVFFSLMILLFCGILVWSNFRSEYLLIKTTNNSMPYNPSAIKWPYYKKAYFYFDHRGLYELAKDLDEHFYEGTYFLSLRYNERPRSHVYSVLDKYMTIYSRNYQPRLITDILTVEDLARRGKLKRLLYLDSVKVPFYTGNGRTLVRFPAETTETVFRNNQVVLKEAVFR